MRNFAPVPRAVIAIACIGFLFLPAFVPAGLAQTKLPPTGEVVVDEARFTVITPECIRLEYQSQKHFIDDPSLFAVNRAQRFTGFTLSQSSTQTVIDTGKIRLVYTPNGEPFSSSNLRTLIRDEDGEVEWKPGTEEINNLGGIRNLDEVKGQALMEPALLSRDGWHVIDDSKRLIFKNGWVASRPKDAGIDWYLFGYGRDYKAGLKAFTSIGGPVPLPRKYVFGSWYSRYWPHSAQDYQRIVREYHEHDFPLDILVMDMDWHKKDNWTGYSWNRDLFPDPQGYLKWLHAQKLFATLNDHAGQGGGIKPFEDNYIPFAQAMGTDPSKKVDFTYDAGNKKYFDNAFKFIQDPVEDMGVDFWWLDYWSDDPNLPFNRLVWINDYYFNHSERKGLRGQDFTRWGDWGDHRHPIQFSGDSFILWSTLAFEVPFTANSGNAGIFFWSHDIGGYQGKRNGELLARWTQFGAVSAALRLHSENSPNLDKRPWSYDKDIEDSMRAAFHLRSELFPYIYSSAWQSHEYSIPMLRPLYIEYPKEDAAYQNPQEYLFGDAVLAAPIVAAGTGANKTASQMVWFPEGVWYDWFTGERIQGEVRRCVSKDLNSFPLYARGGIPIPMQPYTERMTTEPLKTLIVRIYPGESGQTGRYVLYEDDGISKDYLQSGRGLTALNYSSHDDEADLTIGATEGEFKGQLAARSYEIDLMQTGHGLKAKANGQSISVKYDPLASINRIFMHERSIREPLTIKLQFPHKKKKP